ncbi:MAG: substrate-binding domain-containing protein [Planctomycetales bacterium]|nr:substrate-binding domain-containing protein [Planctomycetales bacterium]
MTKVFAAIIGSVCLLAAALFMMRRNDQQVSEGNRESSLVVFCAASNRAVMEAVKEDYQKEFGAELQIQYGGSQTLLSSIEVSQTGDLYLPADDSYLDIARSSGLVAEVLPLARMQAVVAVPKGNPQNIKSFADLLRPEIQLIQASPDATAIGKVTRKLLSESGQWERLDKATRAYRTTVNDVANDVLIGAANAGIVYDAVLHTYPDLEFVELPELLQANSQVSIGVIASTKRPQTALHFARYLAAKDRGLVHYRAHGFRIEEGDQWSDVPELTLFAGSMLRPAIEDTVAAFEKREGVKVTTVYNGCGILVGNMKTGSVPDAYFACDNEFMSQVADFFPKPVAVSQNQLVILVQKGNPLNISTLTDLTRQGLRVGVGHEKQCAMGWLTQNTFREGKLQNEINANVTVRSPTGDMLVNQMRAGALDAAVAYLSNAAGSAEFLDAIPIDGLDCALATQPWAIAKNSQHTQLASRLFNQICSAESQQIFSAEGFRWQFLEAKETASNSVLGEK